MEGLADNGSGWWWFWLIIGQAGGASGCWWPWMVECLAIGLSSWWRVWQFIVWLVVALADGASGRVLNLLKSFQHIHNGSGWWWHWLVECLAIGLSSWWRVLQLVVWLIVALAGGASG